jgi:polyhydroxybutyrate depolymerase
MRGLKIDPKRIYSTGFSNGAMFSQLLGAELPETFAAITAVATTTGARAANDPTNTHYSLLTPKAPIPVMLTMGKRDNHVPPDGRPSDDGIIYDTASESIAFWAKANQCGGAPANEGLPNRAGIITRYNGCKADTVLVLLELMGHQWPDADTRDGFLASQAVMDFFNQHPKP